MYRSVYFDVADLFDSRLDTVTYNARVLNMSQLTLFCSQAGSPDIEGSENAGNLTCYNQSSNYSRE